MKYGRRIRSVTSSEEASDRAHQFPGHVTASDDSVGTGCIGAGFVWLGRSECGGERIGRGEEGTGSDHTTGSEVLCRLFDRWVGQGGKASLANTTDADILEYIFAKLAARIEAKAKTFLVKVKSHRGKPLNEGSDDLTDS